MPYEKPREICSEVIDTKSTHKIQKVNNTNVIENATMKSIDTPEVKNEQVDRNKSKETNIDILEDETDKISPGGQVDSDAISDEASILSSEMESEHDYTITQGNNDKKKVDSSLDLSNDGEKRAENSCRNTVPETLEKDFTEIMDFAFNEPSNNNENIQYIGDQISGEKIENGIIKSRLESTDTVEEHNSNDDSDLEELLSLPIFVSNMTLGNEGMFSEFSSDTRNQSNHYFQPFEVPMYNSSIFGTIVEPSEFNNFQKHSISSLTS